MHHFRSCWCSVMWIAWSFTKYTQNDKLWNMISSIFQCFHFTSYFCNLNRFPLNEFWSSPILTRDDRKGAVLHQVKYIINVVVQPEETNTDKKKKKSYGDWQEWCRNLRRWHGKLLPVTYLDFAPLYGEQHHGHVAEVLCDGRFWHAACEQRH